MPTMALVWLAFLAPFVIWPPIVIVIMRRMDNDHDYRPPAPKTSDSSAAITAALLRAPSECCGASVILALGPAARQVGHEPAVVCLERLLAAHNGAEAPHVCRMRESH